jgi:hypothetical protein
MTQNTATAARQDADRGANLARLAASVRQLHAAGWTWRWSTQISGSGVREHQYDRPGMRLLVELAEERVLVCVQRRRSFAAWASVLAVTVSYEALGESALVDLIAGLS